MKDVLVRAGSSLLAAAIGYAALTVFTDGMRVWLKVVVALTLGLIALGIAVWASSGQVESELRAVRIASNLKVGEAKLKNIKAEVDGGQTVSVASDIESRGPVEITDAKVQAVGKKS